MRVRWTTNAADDLARIVEHVRADSPTAAQHIARTIYEGIASLRSMPSRGRVGRVENTRELVFSPYIAVYEILGEDVQVLRIRHGAQNWP
jgi:toxin ParE1/3/4